MDPCSSAPPPRRALEELVTYRVDVPDGPAGVLEGVGREEGDRLTLTIAQGWFGRRKHDVPASAIADVDHGARRILLAAGAAEPERRGLWLRLFG